MNICLYTMHSDATIGEMAAITVPNKQEYCQRHGYSYQQEPYTGAMFPGFERLPKLIELMGKHDWVFWLGCDALITNLAITMESLIDEAHGIVIATDSLQTQMDSFLIQGPAGGLGVIERVWDLRLHPIGIHEEQSTLDALLKLPEFKKVAKFVPQRKLNSYRYSLYEELGGRYLEAVDWFGNDGEWQPGDFVFHVPGRPLETKIATLREIAPLIQK